MTSAEAHQEQTERYHRVIEILRKYEAVMAAAIKHFGVGPEWSCYVSQADMAFFRSELGVPLVGEAPQGKQPLDYEPPPGSKL